MCLFGTTGPADRDGLFVPARLGLGLGRVSDRQQTAKQISSFVLQLEEI